MRCRFGGLKLNRRGYYNDRDLLVRQLPEHDRDAVILIVGIPKLEAEILAFNISKLRQSSAHAG